MINSATVLGMKSNILEFCMYLFNVFLGFTMQRHLFIPFVIIAFLGSLSLECVGEDKCKNLDEYLGKMKAIYKHAQSPYDADRRLTDLAIQYEGKIPDYGKYGPVTVFGAMCVGCSS